jgi:hypothetical protein
MPVVVSPTATTAELQGLLSSISSAGSLVIRNSFGTPIATVPLPNPPAVIFNQQLVILGLPTSVVSSSLVPPGSIPASADILDFAGNPVITGIAVSQQQNTVVLGSSAAFPGGTFGIIGAAISIP